VVIIIAMAISLGIVFFLVLFGLLVAVCRRSDRQEEGRNQFDDDSQEYEDSDVSHLQHRPTSLLAALNAATSQVLEEKEMKRKTLGGGMGGGVEGAGAVGLGLGEVGIPVGSDEAEMEDEEGGVERHVKARYSFHAENPGE
jgi:hypothetical protein